MDYDISLLEILYAPSNTTDDNIVIKNGRRTLISCGTGRLEYILNDGSVKSYGLLQAVCYGGNIFLDGSNPIDFRQLSCQSPIQSSISVSNSNCPNGGIQVFIGIDVISSLIRLLTVCFDPAFFTPFYSSQTLTGSIRHSEVNLSEPIYIQDDYVYSFLRASIDTIYHNQSFALNSLLGLPETDNTYIKNDSSNYFLVPGQLSSPRAFVYGAEKSATFHYMNTAPQWKKFKDGNWKTLEEDINQYVIDNDLSVNIYTGTYGTTALQSASNDSTPLYLYTNNYLQALPVPRLFWKLVHDTHNSRAIVFLGVNNPYEIDLNKDIICPDVSDMISWKTWDHQLDLGNLQHGYLYACSYESFKEVVTFGPDKLAVSGLLV